VRRFGAGNEVAEDLALVRGQIRRRGKPERSPGDGRDRERAADLRGMRWQPVRRRQIAVLGQFRPFRHKFYSSSAELRTLLHRKLLKRNAEFSTGSKPEAQRRSENGAVPIFQTRPPPAVEVGGPAPLAHGSLRCRQFRTIQARPKDLKVASGAPSGCGNLVVVRQSWRPTSRWYGLPREGDAPCSTCGGVSS
jgi:hypothetical protein